MLSFYNFERPGLMLINIKNLVHFTSPSAKPSTFIGCAWFAWAPPHGIGEISFPTRKSNLKKVIFSNFLSSLYDLKYIITFYFRIIQNKRIFWTPRIPSWNNLWKMYQIIQTKKHENRAKNEKFMPMDMPSETFFRDDIG